MGKLRLLVLAAVYGFFLFFSTPKVLAQVNCSADINLDGFVDISDYSLLTSDFFKTSPANLRSDINIDGIVDITDYAILANNFFQTCAPSTSNEWTQFAGSPQRTSFSTTGVSTPWRYKWQWNGADTNGKPQADHLSVPKLVQPVSGGGRIYMVAADAVYALNRNTGAVIWSRSNIGTLSATVAYDAGYVYVPSQNGSLYKLNAADGTITQNVVVGGSLGLAPLVANGVVYVGSSSGELVAVNTGNLAIRWRYQGGAPMATPAALSATRSLLVVNTQDLYVHAINIADGTRKWRVKPTSRTYQSGNPNTSGAQFEGGWPVIAEKAGVVFVRYRLDWDTLWGSNPYPTTNAAIKTFLQNNPNQQALYALNINTGAVSFIPAVGNGGAGDGGNLPMGPQPVIKEINGKEVAYIIWRNGLTCASGWCDGREDATIGEMVLDATTVSGYTAGDVRFVQFIDIQTDEMMNIAMAGSTIFHSHWLINAAKTITDRSAGLGATYASPIKTVDAPNVIWRQCYCPPENQNCNPIDYPGGSGNTWCPSNCPFNSSTRYCSQGLFSYGDQRGYPPGFYQYHNSSNRGTTPFTVVTDGLVLVKTNDGGVIALEQGNPTANDTNISFGSQPDLAQVLGLKSPLGVVDYTQAANLIGTTARFNGVVKSVVNRLPKAVYIGFTDPHDGALLVRVFAKDVQKFDYDLESLVGKQITVSGYVSLYWPDNIDPEIVVSEPGQIVVQESN